MVAGDSCIAVIGAGPAGAMAARLLAGKGKNVLLLDGGRQSPDRIEMLPPAATIAFRAGGLGYVLDDPDIAAVCQGIVRLGPKAERQDFLNQPGGRGLAVHRPRFDAAIKAAATEVGAVCMHGRLVGLKDHGDLFSIQIAGVGGPRSLAAQTIIDASGRAAVAARRLGAGVVVWENLIAEQLPADDTGDAWLHFSLDSDGWRYSISGPHGQRDAWRIAKAQRGQRRPVLVDASSRSIVPAAGRRWVAIGDAACAFDPICCQGLAHAASSALAAVGMIIQNGTIHEMGAQAYDFACRTTGEMTEADRRYVYGAMQPAEAADLHQN